MEEEKQNENKFEDEKLEMEESEEESLKKALTENCSKISESRNDLVDGMFRKINCLDDEDHLNNVKCKVCSSNTSIFWRQVGIRVYVCNNCFQNKSYLNLYKNRKLTEENIFNKKSKLQENVIKPINKNSTKQLTRSSRLSAKRVNNTKLNMYIKTEEETFNQVLNQISSNDDTSSVSSLGASVKNRRNAIFKRFKPKKLEITNCSVVSSQFVFHRGSHLQIDDIVALIDDSTNQYYYAQIRGFLTDQYANKSAILTWLLPTDLTNTSKFDEYSFVIGPDEEFPRSLDCMQFICRPKSDYFKRKHFLYDTASINQPTNCYVSDIRKNLVNLYTFSLFHDHKEEKFHQTELV